MIKMKNIGSNFTLVFGSLFLITGLSKATEGFSNLGFDMINTGFIMLVGALVYKSAKKRAQAEVKNSILRRIAELISLIAAILVVILQNNFVDRIYENPIPILALAWILIIYLIINIKINRLNN
jgi:ABC-type Co2+ transport system permease subunit